MCQLTHHGNVRCRSPVRAPASQRRPSGSAPPRSEIDGAHPCRVDNVAAVTRRGRAGCAASTDGRLGVRSLDSRRASKTEAEMSGRSTTFPASGVFAQMTFARATLSTVFRLSTIRGSSSTIRITRLRRLEPFTAFPRRSDAPTTPGMFVPSDSSGIAAAGIYQPARAEAYLGWQTDVPKTAGFQRASRSSRATATRALIQTSVYPDSPPVQLVARRIA
jgi:hypothetical protein